MSIFFDAPVSPDTLTAFVREIPRTSYLGQKVQVETVADNKAKVSTLTRNNGVARYRSFDGRIHVADRGIGTAQEILLPALSDSLNQGEYETLQLAFAQTGGTRTEALEQAIYNDAEILTRNVHNRLDLACGEVLASGKLQLGTTIKDTDGFQAEIDYGVPATNLPTAATVWTDTDADVIGDLMAWVDAYGALNGVGPARISMDRSVLRALQRNAGLIGYLGGTGRTALPLTELQNLLGSEFGLEIETISGSYNVDGTQVPVIPTDRVVLLPQDINDVLAVTLGVSATALELVDSNQAEMSFGDAAGIVGVVVKEGPPVRKFTFVDAVGLPTVKNANAIFSAKVK